MASVGEFEGSPKSWPPLGLPAGSVRAILTLTVVAVVAVNLARGRPVDLLWKETLLVVLTHYFASRRFVSLPEDVIHRLEKEGVIDPERHPLFLPRHSIRTLIIVSFVGLAVYLYREQRLFVPPAASMLVIVFAYLLGALAHGVKSWWRRRRPRPPSRFWRDAPAIVVLAALMLVAIPEFLETPRPIHEDVLKGALGLVLFYFGAR